MNDLDRDGIVRNISAMTIKGRATPSRPHFTFNVIHIRVTGANPSVFANHHLRLP